MKDVVYLLFHLLTTLAKLIRPDGSRTVIAENPLLKQQLIIHSRARERAPNLSTQDRALLGFWSLFLNPRRLFRSAIIIKPSTLLRFHNALKKRKYRNLYSPSGGRKPRPKGPSTEIIDAIVEMKRRNPRFGCPRIIGFGVHAGSVDGPALCRMFNDATSRQGWPERLSSDNDLLFQYHRWKANLRVLDIEEIKSIPHVPMSHPFVERLISSVRRELLDQTFFRIVTDLENKLRDVELHRILIQ